MHLSMSLLRTIAVAAAVGFLAFAWAEQGAAPAHAAYTDRDGDGAIDIAEEISGSNPGDAQSFPENRGVEFLSGNPVCSDGIDNDGDGLIDTADVGCSDSDNDLVPDDVEALLGSDPHDASSFPEDSRLDTIVQFYGFPFSFCGDLVDNDGDGLVDGNDPGCAPIRSDSDDFDDATEKQFGSDPTNPNSVPEHELVNPGSCTDGRDNDLDGATDGADTACGVPDNDNQADATAITALPYSSGPIVMKNATVEPGEAQSLCTYGTQAGTVWFRYDVAADGVLIADTSGSSVDTVLAVWRDDGSRLTEIACDYGYDGADYQARAAIPVDAGETLFFQVQVFPYGTPFPTLTFNLAAGQPPANDSYLSSTEISGLPFSDSVDTSAATRQFGEPTPACAYPQLQSTIWYSYTADSDSLLLVDTTGSDFMTTIGIWTDSKFGLAPIDCAYSSFRGTAVAPARIALHAEAGWTYHFQIGGAGDETYGTVHLALGTATAAPNDDFAGATVIGGLPYTDNVDMLTATAETGEPAPSCFYGGQPTASVWYRFTAPRDMVVEATAPDAAELNAFAAVYQGDALDELTTVACGNPYNFYPDFRMGFEAKAGETYLIQLGMVRYDVYPPVPLGAGGVPQPAPGSGIIAITFSEVVMPACGAPDFTFADPAGDTSFPAPPPATSPDFPPPPGPIPHDITSVSGGATDDSYCLTIDFAGPIDPPSAGSPRSVSTYVDFDLDENRQTGYASDFQYACGRDAYLGVDLAVNLGPDSGTLIPLYPSVAPPSPEGGPLVGLALYDDRSITVILPLDALSAALVSDPGGPEAFNFALFATSAFGPVSDCVPNGGFIHAPTPAAAGDINCDGTVNAIDTAVILQMVAGLIPGVPCPWVGDVNGTGIIGPIDAELILQYDAGLLPELEMPPMVST